MTSCRQLFKYLEESPEAIVLVSEPDDTTLEVRGRGSICIKLDNKYGGWTLRFADVRYVPHLTDRLLAGRKLTKNALNRTFLGDECSVKDDNGETVFTAFADKDNDGDLFLVEGRRTNDPDVEGDEGDVDGAGSGGNEEGGLRGNVAHGTRSVSYTHLTLPTKRRV